MGRGTGALELVPALEAGEMLHPLSGCTSALSLSLPFFTACRCSLGSVTHVVSALAGQGGRPVPLHPAAAWGHPDGRGRSRGQGTAGLLGGWSSTGQDAGVGSETPIASVPDASASCVQ